MNPEKSGSNFASLPGALLLLVLCLISGRFPAPLLSAALFAAFLISFTAWFWGRMALKGLETELTGTSLRVFPGETVQFMVTLANQKWLPLFWAEVRFPAQEQKIFPLSSVRTNWILPWQKVTSAQLRTAERRGIWHMNHLEVITGDGLGLSVRQDAFSPENPLLFVVYPKLVPVRTDILPLQAAMPEADSRGCLEDVSLLRGSRDYAPGDPVKRLNWRILARSGKMEVNLYEHVSPREISFLLDLESFGEYRTYESGSDARIINQITALHSGALEDMISLAASLIFVLAERGCRLRLILPEVLKAELPENYASQEGEETPVLPAELAGKEKAGSGGGLYDPESPEDRIPELLTALSGIRYYGGPAMMPHREVLRHASSLGQIFVMALSPEKVSCKDLLDSLPERAVTLITDTSENGHPLFPVIERRRFLV